jgi:N-acetylmuramoyl-L-alanine amidase
MGVKQNSAVRRPCKPSTSRALIGFLAAALLFSWPCMVVADRFSSPIGIVALDPGHGGNDTGGRGQGGTIEKQVALSLARRMALEMEPDYKVVLTRSDDYNVPLNERAAIANNQKADLLISLHTSSGFLHATEGINIYSFKQAGKAPQPLFTTGGPIAWDHTQLPHAAAAKQLAENLRRTLAAMPGAPEVRVMQTPLTMLKGARMPAVLIEIGYLTNPATEKSLNAEDRQTAYARAIIQGIDTYMAGLRRDNSTN